jgi:hypothetical protein
MVLAGTPNDSREARSHRSRVDPIAEARYRVQFTADAELKRKLEFARDLMSHQNPTRDLAPIVQRALELLIGELLKRRAGRAARPRENANAVTARLSRATQRTVSERDGLCCSFIDEHGHRCNGRAFLEYDHRQPLGKGGTSAPENVRLLCRAHNQLCAELEYGRDKIAAEIARRRRRPNQAGERLAPPERERLVPPERECLVSSERERERDDQPAGIPDRL